MMPRNHHDLASRLAPHILHLVLGEIVTPT